MPATIYDHPVDNFTGNSYPEEAIRIIASSSRELNNIVVLEDDMEAFTEIRSTLEFFNFGTILFARSCEDVLRYAKEGVASIFILDINLGSGREFEGLDAVEMIKAIERPDKPLFISVLSNHDGRLRRQAEKLGVNYYQHRTHNVKEDIGNIVRKLMEKHVHKIEGAWEKLRDSGSKEPPENDPPNGADDVDNDPNYRTYLDLLSNTEWRAVHDLDFIAIVDGNVFGYDKNERRLLNRTARQYPERPFFFTQITDDEGDDVIDIPSVLSHE